VDAEKSVSCSSATSAASVVKELQFPCLTSFAKSGCDNFRLGSRVGIDLWTHVSNSDYPAAMTILTSEPALKPLNRLVGNWTTEATHPALPGVVVHGRVAVEWLEGARFLIHRARTDHPDFPDSISIIGFTDRDRVDDSTGTVPPAGIPTLSMHYFDSRGVARVYEAGIDDKSWRTWRDAPGFSQRFTGTFTDGYDTIAGLSQLRRESHWEDDLKITYRRDAVGR
jgi:hypothetical protein